MARLFFFLFFTNLFSILPAYADDFLYAPPAQLKNCQRIVNTINCEFDNSFLTFYYFNTNDLFGGDYQFDSAVAWPDGKTALYHYKNRHHNMITLMTSYYPIVAAALEEKTGKWEAPTSSGFRRCLSQLPADCSFTHTPWHALQPISPDHVQRSISQRSLTQQGTPSSLKQQSYRLSTLHQQGNIIIENHTDYPVTLHMSDFNSAKITWLQPTIPAHHEIIAASYQRPSMQKLMFDVQLGSGLRNTDNTALIFVKDKKFYNINYHLMLNGKSFIVKPVMHSFHMDEIRLRVKLDSTA